jgi:hypothetical protein
LLEGVSIGRAWAEPLPIAAQHIVRSAREGWQLSLSLDHELVNAVPYLANATSLQCGTMQNR